jgi:hypothetical protein
MKKYLNIDVYKDYYGDLDREEEESGDEEEVPYLVDRDHNTVAIEVTDSKAMLIEENDEDDLGEELPEDTMDTPTTPRIRSLEDELLEEAEEEEEEDEEEDDL